MSDLGVAETAARRDGGLAAWSVAGIVFTAAVFAWGTIFYGHSFYLAALQARHGWSAGLISTAIMSFFLAGILATIAVGRVIDRHGAAPVLAWGALSVGGGVIALGYIDAPWQLFLVYPLLGTGYPALATATISAALVPWFERRYGLALSLALSGASVGGALVPPVMVALDAALGFATTVTVVGGTTLAVLLPLAWLLHRLGRPDGFSRDNDPASTGSRSVLRRPAFWLITVACSLGLMAQVGFLAHQIPLLQGDVGRPTAAMMVSVTAASALVGRLVVGALAAYLALGRLAAASYLTQAAGLAVLALGHGVAVLYLGSALAGFVVGAIVMLPPLLLRQAFGAGDYGRIYGLANVGLYVGAGLGPALAGWLHDWQGGYGAALWCLIAVHLAAAAVVLLHRPRR